MMIEASWLPGVLALGILIGAVVTLLAVAAILPQTEKRTDP